MYDIRKNLEGTKQLYELFKPLMQSKPEGKVEDNAIANGFTRLETLYSEVSGDALPAPPATWTSEKPANNSEADKQSAFGRLYFGVGEMADETRPDSVVASMNRAAALFGLGEK
jgi:hypothetical protein